MVVTTLPCSTALACDSAYCYGNSIAEAEYSKLNAPLLRIKIRPMPVMQQLCLIKTVAWTTVMWRMPEIRQNVNHETS
jgi:hypothetical protein